MSTIPRANHNLHGRCPGDSGAAVAVAGTGPAVAADDTAAAVVGAAADTAAVDSAAAAVGAVAADDNAAFWGAAAAVVGCGFKKGEILRRGSVL